MRQVTLILALVCLAGAPLAAQQPSSEEREGLLKAARESALRYANSLPNFTCTQSVIRTQRNDVRELPPGRFTIELTYFNRQERYKLTAIDGNRTAQSLDPLGGLVSGGEFGGLLLHVFEPSAAAEFAWKGWSSVRKTRAAVFTYRVPRARSQYVVGFRGDDGRMLPAVSGFHGEVAVSTEGESRRVLRLTAEADDFPRDSGITAFYRAVEYEMRTVAGSGYLLPARSDFKMERRSSAIQHVVIFQGYRKLEAEPVIAPGAVPPSESLPVFRTASQLALVGFQVITPKGQLIHDLSRDEIELRDDGVPQKIAVFEGGKEPARTVPVEVALLFDCSGSVHVSGAFNTNVFKHSLLDEFENVSVAVYGFSDYLVRATRPTRDAAALKKAIDTVRAIAPRSTPLFNSIADTAKDFGAGGGSTIRMMVILSDGESWVLGGPERDLDRKEKAVQAARDAGIALYPVLLTGAGVDLTNPTPPTGPNLWLDSHSEFTALGRKTGGRSLSAFMDTDVVASVLPAMATQIRATYIVGYYPERSPAPKEHKLEVVLIPKHRGELYGGTRTVVH